MEHRRAWITTSDGTRLAARLWLPDEQPAAVLLEALPYRMDDLTASYSSEYERLCGEGGLCLLSLVALPISGCFGLAQGVHGLPPGPEEGAHTDGGGRDNGDQ